MFQLEELRDRMIIDGVKRPNYVLDELTPAGLAVWFMDDGFKIKERGARQAKNCIRNKWICSRRQNIHKDWFKDTFGGTANVTKAGTLLLSVEGSKQVCKIISPFVILRCVITRL